MTKQKQFVAFISHSSVEARTAQLICEYLESKGLSCWIAPRNIDSGKDYASQIMFGIENSQLIILLLSENSNKSEQVLREIERAAAKCVPILVIELERVKQLSKSLEYFISQRQWLSCHSELGLPNLQPYVYESILKAVKINADIKNSFFHEANVNIPGPKKNFLPLVLAALVFLGSVGGYLYYSHNRAELTPMNQLQASQSVSFGKYRGNSIIWTVLDVKDAGEDDYQIRLISKNPISYKPFDIAHGGEFKGLGLSGNSTLQDVFDKFNFPETDDYQKTSGSPDWGKSVLRTWLNSDEEKVSYPILAPNQKNIYGRIQNPIFRSEMQQLSEPGFLKSFDQFERSLLISQQVKVDDFSRFGSCPIAKAKPDTTLFNMPKFVEIIELEKINLEECKGAHFSELVTIPSIHDYFVIYRDEKLSQAISLNYRNLSDNFVWLINPCGNFPYEICSLFTNQFKDRLDDRAVISYVTNLAGVQPIISIKVSKEAMLSGSGTILAPFVLER